MCLDLLPWPGRGMKQNNDENRFGYRFYNN